MAYQHRVFSVAYRMLRSRAEAEDIAQEVFLRVHRGIAPPGETTEKGLYVSYAQRAGIARVPVDELRIDRGPDRNARRRLERTLAVAGGVPSMGVLRHLVPPG